MNFVEFSQYLEKLENTSKRLEITSILADLIKDLSNEDIDLGIYLALGTLKAPHENPKFNIADKMMMRAVASAFETELAKVETVYSKLGDLGDTVYDLSKNETQHDLPLREVHKILLDLAAIEGVGSQELKTTALAELLRRINKLSAKYVTRIVLGTTRLGFTELTVIDALSQYLQDNKLLRAQIEEKYNIHPDLGFISKQLKLHKLEGIKKINIEIGTPILPQRCQRLSSPEEIIEKMDEVIAEFKLDGTRAQLHLAKNKSVKAFTRNLEEVSHQYPDIVEAVHNQIDAQEIILDGEVMGFDKNSGDFLPFQQIMQRKRKHNIEEVMKQIPLQYFVFDILYLNGESLLQKPLEERKKILEKVINKGNTIKVAEFVRSQEAKDIENYFTEASEKRLEGLILKKPTAPYMAGARSFAWVKYKVADTKLLDDTVDCVVLGYYFGKGVRTQFGIGGFLVGVYDEKNEIFKTITKVGTGLKEEDFVYLKKEADKILVQEKPNNIDSNKMFDADVWVKPQIVVEIGADELSISPSHTAGYALRFPRLIKFRTDKKATDATTLKEIQHMYKIQKRV